MRRLLFQWVTFSIVLAVAVVPAWLGVHFRQFMPYMAGMTLFAILAVIWLRLSRSVRNVSDE